MDGPSLRVRSTQRFILDIIQEGKDGSPTFRELLAAIDHSNVIVYVEPGVCAFGHLDGCLVAFMNVSPFGDRYLRVAINPRRDRVYVIGIVAHELQHVREVADAPEVLSVDGMLALFQRIGKAPACPPPLKECYETQAALRTGEAVMAELQRKR
jgi:hypothetical protein